MIINHAGSAPTPIEVLGVPFLPSATATGTTNRLRAGLRRLRSAMGPPPIQILESLFGQLDHRVLVALCEADVPDQLTGPMTIAELARRTESDPERLERLVRFGSIRRWLRIDRRGRVRPTRVTAFLRTDHPGGWRSWVDFAGGDDVMRAVSALSTRANPVDTFAATNGQPFFEWMATHPERGATFDRAMAAGGRMHALALAAAVDWSTSTRVCDVGGGTGDLIAALLDLEPTLVGTVLDRPAVIARAVEHPRLDAQPGDAFVAVPAGFDTYLLVNVLHDWNDDDAVAILRRVAEVAVLADSRVFVIEGDRTVVPRDGLAICTDVLMAAMTNGGHERSPAAFADLGRAAALRLVQSIPLASGDLAHEFRSC